MSSSAASSDRHHRKISILLGMGLGLLMAGCTLISTSTPEETIKTVVSTAKHSRMGDVREVMTGSALDAFGTKEGLADLRGKLSKILAIAPPELITSEKGEQGDNHYGDVRRIFRTNVAGLTKEGAPASYTVHITCDVTYEEEHTPFMKGICRADPNDPSGPDQCDPDTPAFDWEGEVQHCRVSEIAATAG